MIENTDSQAITEPDAASRIEELTQQIHHHNKLYYDQAKPEISDREFDQLLNELEDMEARFPDFAEPDSPTRQVGGKPAEGFESIDHAVPMLSINNTYSPDEINDFDARLRRILKIDGPLPYLVELKIDGVSASLYYKNGELQYAATRGNGITGDVITNNMLTLPQVRKFLPGWVAEQDAILEVRGEVYMEHSAFDTLNEKRLHEGLEPFANPRNVTAGSLKLLDPRQTARRPLRIFVYAVGAVENYPLPQTHSELLKHIESLGLPVNKHRWQCNGVEHILKIIDEWEHKRKDLPYDTDGLVIKVDDRQLYEKLGSTSKAPRWLCAYKFSAEQAQTTVEEITVQVGRTGAITPVANLKPVLLAGSTVSRATLHNRDEIERLDLRVGDQVMIEKAGDIIPKVIRVLEHLRTESNTKPYEFPTQCPACQSTLQYDSEEVAVRCENISCHAQIKERIRHFASRNALDIEGLGTKLVQQLVDESLVQRFSDLYRLDMKTLAGLDRMAEKSAQNLIDALEISKSRPLSAFLFALGIRHAGANTSRLLAENFGSIAAIKQASIEQLEAIEDIGSIVASSIVAFFAEEKNQQELNALQEMGFTMALSQKERAEIEARKNAAQNEDNPLAGKVFVLTGTLPTLKRSEAKKMLESRGARVSGSVSAKVDYLLAGEKAGSKLTKAEKLGITIIDEAQLLKWIDES